MIVDHIWSEYDADGNGTLDKEETLKFITDYLESATGETDFQDQEFLACFNQIFKDADADGNGVLDKEEMAEFLQKISDFT